MLESRSLNPLSCEALDPLTNWFNGSKASQLYNFTLPVTLKHSVKYVQS